MHFFKFFYHYVILIVYCIVRGISKYICSTLVRKPQTLHSIYIYLACSFTVRILELQNWYIRNCQIKTLTHVVMKTAPAAMCGCMSNKIYVALVLLQPYLFVNIMYFNEFRVTNKPMIAFRFIWL